MTFTATWWVLGVFSISRVHYFQGDARDLQVGPHPHIGLQTFTWMIEGEVLHRDSLNHEQVIRPGQVNLMTAGSGISHTEESAPGQRRVVRRLAHQRHRRFQLPRVSFEALLMQGLALSQMIVQHTCVPLAKASSCMRLDAIANRNDHIQVVVLDGSRNLTRALLANYPA